MSDLDKLQHHVSKLCQWHIQKMKIEHDVLMRKFWKTMGVVVLMLALAAFWEWAIQKYLRL